MMKIGPQLATLHNISPEIVSVCLINAKTALFKLKFCDYFMITSFEVIAKFQGKKTQIICFPSEKGSSPMVNKFFPFGVNLLRLLGHSDSEWMLRLLLSFVIKTILDQPPCKGKQTPLASSW